MRTNIIIGFLCIAGAVINVITNIFASQFMFLPLYMDTIWTIAVTLLGGPVWGCITGILTNFIGHTVNFWGYEGYLFVLCNIATALLTWMFCRLFPDKINFKPIITNSFSSAPAKSRYLDEVMNKVFVLSLLSFSLCLAMSILGGLITFFIEFTRSGVSIQNPASAPTMFYSEMPFLAREILSRIPINLIDRLLSAFAGFGIAFLLSKVLFKGFKKTN